MSKKIILFRKNFKLYNKLKHIEIYYCYELFYELEINKRATKIVRVC